MNWKNVLYLLRVERKSGRLVRGIKATHYREHGVLAYWPYWVAAIIGIIGGFIANVVVESVYGSGVSVEGLNLPPLPEAANGFLVTVPTLILIMSIVFTMLQQIQLAGLRKTSQIMYWLPVTWQEHTLASVLSNLLGFPIAIVVGVSAGLIVFSSLQPHFIHINNCHNPRNGRRCVYGQCNHRNSPHSPNTLHRCRLQIQRSRRHICTAHRLFALLHTVLCGLLLHIYRLRWPSIHPEHS